MQIFDLSYAANDSDSNLESWNSSECLKPGNDHYVRVGIFIGICCSDEASAADLCQYAFFAVRSLRLAAEVNGWISRIFGARGATAQDLQWRACRCVEHWRHTVCDAGVSLSIPFNQNMDLNVILLFKLFQEQEAFYTERLHDQNWVTPLL